MLKVNEFSHLVKEYEFELDTWADIPLLAEVLDEQQSYCIHAVADQAVCAYTRETLSGLPLPHAFLTTARVLVSGLSLPIDAATAERNYSVARECLHCPTAGEVDDAYDKANDASWIFSDAHASVCEFEEMLTAYAEQGDTYPHQEALWWTLRSLERSLDPAFHPQGLPSAPAAADRLSDGVEKTWLLSQLAGLLVRLKAGQKQLLARVLVPFGGGEQHLFLLLSERSHTSSTIMLPPLTSARIAWASPAGWLRWRGTFHTVHRLPAHTSVPSGANLMLLGREPDGVYLPALLTLTSQLMTSPGVAADLVDAYQTATAVLAEPGSS